jgi:molybdate transport system permease protein
LISTRHFSCAGPRSFRARGPGRRALPTLAALVAACVIWPSVAVAQARSPLDVWSAVSAGPLVQRVADAWRDEGGPEVRVRTDATSRIVPQIAAGAPADVLVTADRAWMLEAADLDLVEPGAARLVALNRLALVERRPAGSEEVLQADPSTLDDAAVRARIERVSGLGPHLALAGPDVPVGRYAREALAAFGLESWIGGETVSVGNARAVVIAVAMGEVDLGIAYASDAFADPGVRVVGLLPTESHTPAEVWAAPVRRAVGPDAEEFVERLASPAEADRIRSAGFVPPAGGAALGPEGVPAAAPDAGTSPRSSTWSTSPPALWPVVFRSILVGLLAVLLATLPAVALGRWLARTRSPARGPVGTVMLLPLVLPPVVTGFVLLAVFGSSGILGPALAAVGLRLSFTFWAAVVAAAVVGFPLYAVVVRNAFEAVDPRYEELAWTLGAPPRSTFRRVALPLALPGVVAGAVLALARGLGEFGATIVVAGNIEGETQTLALAVYRLLESPEGRGRIWLFVLASVLIAALGLALWEWLTARQRARLLDGGWR